MIEIATLGPVSVRVDDHQPPPELLWRKHFALLVYLTRSPRLSRSRDHLLGLLWSDRPDETARHSLNEALRILRKVAGPDAIATPPGQVALAAGRVRLDLDELEEHLAAGAPELAAVLVQGEFLEGFAIPGCPAFDDWIHAERLHWRARSVAALQEGARARSRLGDDRGALDFAERAWRLDPDSELAARAMMDALALSGDTPAALACYQLFRTGIAQRLDAEPSPELAGLARRLGRDGGRVARRGPAPAPGEPPRRRPPLVGRAAELARLREVWTRAQAGRAQVALIEGDLGLGKSRLLEDLVRLAVLDGATPVIFRAVDADQDRPWTGTFGLARGLLEAPGVSGASPSAIATFARALPEWADRFPASRSVEPADPTGALREVIGAALGQGGLLIGADDAHHLDRETLAVLVALLRDWPERPWLLTIAGEPRPGNEIVDGLRAALRADLAGVSISLHPLSELEVGALVDWATPDRDPSAQARLTHRIAVDSGGYPLLAVALLDGVLSGMELAETGGAWPRTNATLSQTYPGDLPDNVVGAIRVAFRRLTPDAQRLLGAATVFPGRVDPGALERAIALEPARFDAALGELEWGRWLRADSEGYTFVARIVRDVIARDFLTGADRRRILARLGSPA